MRKGLFYAVLVQIGADRPAETAMRGVLRIYNTQTKINIKLRLFQLFCSLLLSFQETNPVHSFASVNSISWKKIFSAVPAFSELIQYL